MIRVTAVRLLFPQSVLLSSVGQVVTTGWSTFGSTAAMRTYKVPFIICPLGTQRGWNSDASSLELEACGKGWTSR
jgi:hypothetical protein